jgi:two-component system sensor histidine kinase DesK
VDVIEAEISLALPWLSRISLPLTLGSQAGGGLSRQLRTDTFVPLATMAAVTYSVLIPAVELWRYGLESTGAVPTLTAGLATAAYLPLHVRHVRYAARGVRAPYAGWTVAAMAAVIVGLVPYLGAYWLGQFHALAVSVLLVLPSPWSVALFAAIVAAQTPLAFALGHPEMAPFFTIAGALKGLPVFLLIWLVGSARRLRTARLAVADRAVARERLRIDCELRRTVGTALESIAVRGARAGTLAERDATAAGHELSELAEGSRHALAEVRRLIRAYRRTSLRSELHAATTLLAAAGIESRLRVGDGGVLTPDAVPDVVEEEVLAALRADVVRLLNDDTVRECVIAVTLDGGRVLRLDVHANAPKALR